MDKKSSTFKYNFDPYANEKALKSAHSDIKRLIKSFAPFKLNIIVIVFVTIINCVSYVFLPRLAGELIDIFLNEYLASLLGFSDSADLSNILSPVITIVIFFIINALTGLLQGYIASKTVTDYSYSLRESIIDKYNSLPASYLDKHRHSDIFDTITADVDTLNQSLNLCFIRILTAVFYTLTLIIASFFLDSTVGIAMFSTSAAVFIIVILINKTGKKRNNSAAESNISVDYPTLINEYYDGFHVLRLSSYNRLYLDKIFRFSDREKSLKSKAMYASSKNSAFFSAAEGLGTAVICVVSGLGIVAKKLTIGGLESSIIYIRKIMQVFSQLSLFTMIINNALRSSAGIFAFLDTEFDETVKCENVSDSTYKRSGIEFEKITFKYPTAYDCVLTDFSAKAPDRGITVFQGRTGLGKTTLMKLLLGFYSPEKGDIYVGGRNIASFSEKELYEKFSVIVQGSGLYYGTIAFNIAYACPNTPREKVIDIGRKIGLDAFINELPDGYDTVFDPEQPILSDGQIQMILIARAYLINAEYIILDEVTSFLDEENHDRIMKILKEYSRSHGVLIITHRERTAEYADKLIEMKDCTK